MIPGLGRSPGEEHDNPLQYSCLENPHGQRNLVGYSSWDHKESDTTGQLNTARSAFYPLTHFNDSKVLVQKESVIRSVVSDALQPHGL